MDSSVQHAKLHPRPDLHWDPENNTENLSKDKSWKCTVKASGE